MQPAECQKRAAELEVAEAEAEPVRRETCCRWSPSGAHLLEDDRCIARTKGKDAGLVLAHMSSCDICTPAQETERFLRRLVDVISVQRLDISLMRRFGL